MAHKMVIWALFKSAGVLAFIRSIFRPRYRRRNRLCVRGGDNLEGTVSGVCSECGEAQPPQGRQ